MKDYKEEYYKLYDEFDLLDVGNDLKEALKNKILRMFKSIEEPDAQDFHIAGLVLYFSDCKSDSDMLLAHNYFKSSIELDPNYTIARLYSAHCFHDLKQYQKALAEYLKVDGEQIKNDFALWRYVKLLEQIGFCYHKVGKIDESRGYFEKVLSFYENSDLNNLVDAVELYECLDPSDPISTKIKDIENEYYYRSNT